MAIKILTKCKRTGDIIFTPEHQYRYGHYFSNAGEKFAIASSLLKFESSEYKGYKYGQWEDTYWVLHILQPG